MEKRLQSTLDRCDDLFNEKNNIEQVHVDLVSEYNNTKKENEKLLIKNRTLSLEV